MKRLSVIAVTLGLLLPATAPAAPFSYPTERPASSMRVSASVTIAQQFFAGESTNCGMIGVYYASQEQLTYDWNGAVIQAAATEAPCAIWIGDWFASTRWTSTIAMCSAIVHEYGHMLGYEHTSGGIMTPGHGPVYACYKRFLPRGMGRAYRKLYGVPRFASRP